MFDLPHTANPIGEVPSTFSESARLESLYRHQVLGTAPDPRLDAVTRIAAQALRMPIALVTLIDADRVWTKSAAGVLVLPTVSSREDAPCTGLLARPGRRLVVEDAQRDPRFAASKLIHGNPKIGFYAGVPLSDNAGHVLGALCVMDVVPRQLDAQQLRTLSDLATAVDNVLQLQRQQIAQRDNGTDCRPAAALNAQLGWSADGDGRIEFSPDAARLLGPQSLLSRTGWAGIVAPEDLSAFTATWQQAVHGGEQFDAEQRLRLADGSYRWFRIYAALRSGQGGGARRWYGMLEDVTERRQAHLQIAHLAYHDSLTGLPNRARFTELLQNQLSRSAPETPVALLIIDLDNFKMVNDTQGHPAGDTLLRVVAQRISECIRPPDTAARLGGDEFCAVLSLADKRQEPTRSAGRLAARLLEALREPFDLNGHIFAPRASIGVALGWHGVTGCEELLRRADLALYRAKAEGRDTFRIFSPEMDAAEQALKALARDLTYALERDQFELAFLPIVDLRSARIHAFEALLRWHHPTLGLVAPADFIKVAEKTGLIVDIGAWALEQACYAAAAWPDATGIAVNLSAAEFRHRTLLQTVRSALTRSGIAPERLQLEITESLMLPDDETSLTILADLRKLGVRLALDDFGTGYSALTCLRRFKFDGLKIDRSLVDRCAESETERRAMRAVISLSRAFGIATTGEGVETLKELDVLCSEGCDHAQGYLFSKPVSAITASGMIENDRQRPTHRLLFDSLTNANGRHVKVIPFPRKELELRPQGSATA